MGLFILGSFFGASAGVTVMCLLQIGKRKGDETLGLWYLSAVESAVFLEQLHQADTRDLRIAKAALGSYKAQGYHVADRYQAVKKELNKRMAYGRR
ncbi:DUF3789 domain-containing protein [Ethanoligenens harbinense]|uniref:DUF3789 domain-containing protein n=1 Tax=Ethanoligenens harbinense (strain DSM 18485 / JCM 12961 / CGMCC 1.5033 / YUAN-3) TaxID=663278 RepID=E6U934_ETHHY|nr:DUF3789 domain-containing protein [Ethanoligenens harbinense]ADU26098.1 hypothetical protein Ethha_0513 [Ethanoligenens harbinense YUAN-3]AVQ95241.1 DUF3789 domain-containing protein [Ethanoligenens harbinense YUAN-3]AYF37932.1 DUF3789 domain-containing protein [Ethanoligenens harbinense]AYF40652.1 DUF3789 domain-containing protein [Ethanoligenens harbinense]QCN91486.1 DUF3789 domain-containing protein [Ethanoligenens harbinense]